MHDSRAFYGGSSRGRRLVWRGTMLYKMIGMVAQDAVWLWRLHLETFSSSSVL